jgi:hypothetical protein
LLKLTKGTEIFIKIEEKLTPALNNIIEKSIIDMNGYAFQIYSLFVANSTEMTQSYKIICESILSSTVNWQAEMRYLIPALG